MESFDKLVDLMGGVVLDVAKVDAGGKAAGTRVRLAMQEIKKASQAVRGEVLAKRAEK